MRTLWNRSVGVVVRKYRHRHDLTQLELAEKANRGRSTIANVERGDIGLGLDDFVVIFKAMDEDPAKILWEIINETR